MKGLLALIGKAEKGKPKKHADLNLEAEEGDEEEIESEEDDEESSAEELEAMADFKRALDEDDGEAQLAAFKALLSHCGEY